MKRDRYYVVSANPRAARAAQKRWERWEEKCAEIRKIYGGASEKRVASMIRKLRETS